EILRADRGQVDRDVLADRMDGQLELLAGAAGQRELEVLAVVGDALAAEGEVDDVDVLAGASERGLERDAVPAFRDLRAGDAEGEAEAAGGERVERRGGHRGHRRGAGGELEDGRADVDALSLRGDPGQDRGGVGSVGLGGPAD